MTKRLSTKWGRFEICSLSSVQSSAFRLHTQSGVHKLAWRVWLAPDAASWIPSVLLPSSEDEEKMLRGSVPQCEDWLQVWRGLKSCRTWREMEAGSLTEQFIQSTRAEIQQVSRKAIASMCHIIRDTVRSHVHDQLHYAESITLLVDDKAPWRLLRFKAALNFEKFPQQPVLKGVLCVVATSEATATPEMWDNDHSERYASSVHNAARLAFTSSDGVVDEALFNHFRLKVRALCADGCPHAAKTLRVLRRNYFPNAQFLFKDFSHTLRIAAREPLLAEECFNEVWKDLFDGQGFFWICTFQVMLDLM